MGRYSRANLPSVDNVRRWLSELAISSALVVLGTFAANAQSADLTNIRVAGQDTQVGATPIFAAIRQGYFKEAGLDVTFVVMGGGATPMAAALKSGQIDVSVGGASQFMDYIARGAAPGKIVGEITDTLNTIFARKGITDISQLKGKIFGISSINGGDQIFSEAVLGHYGIGPDDVTWVAVGVPVSRLAALKLGRIDAMETSITSLPASAASWTLLKAEDSPVPFVSAAIFVRQGLIDKNKPALQRFVAAIGKADGWIKAHPADAITPCLDTGTNLDVCKSSLAVLSASTNPYTFSPTTRVNMEGIKGMIPILTQDLPQAKNMTVEDFVDSSIAGGGP